MIEVDHVILHHLAAPMRLRTDRALSAPRFPARLRPPARCQRVHHGAHAADALRPDPGLARIAPLQDQLDAAKHRARTPGIGDLAAVHLGFNAQMAFNASDWIDYDACHTLLLCLLLMVSRARVWSACGLELRWRFHERQSLPATAAVIPTPILPAVTSTPNPGTYGNRS